MSFVDRRISQSLIEGFAIASIRADIETRYTNMTKALVTEISIEEFNDIIVKGDMEKIENSRLKYTAFYVYHAKKRISDLDWIVKNRSKFPKLTNSQIFNLIKLRDKLQPNLQNPV